MPTDPNEFTIRLDPGPDGLHPFALAKALEHACKALRLIARGAAQEPNLKLRVVRAAMQSPLSLTVRGEEAQAHAMAIATDRLARGIQVLRTEAVIPPGLDLHSLREVQGIAQIPSAYRTALFLEAPTVGEVAPNLQVAANVDALISRAVVEPYENWATVTGVLDMARTRGNGQFEISDRLLERIIKCRFSKNDPALMEKVRNGLERRVEVYGVAQFDVTDQPVSIMAEDLFVIDAEDLPTLDDLAGIDFTGEQDHADYVRELRDED